MKVKVVYSPKVLSEDHYTSPSGVKPKLLVEYLLASDLKDMIEIVEPVPVTTEDFYLCHDKKYVDDILSLKEPNGFKTYSRSVAESLPYTNGAMYMATKLALEHRTPTCAAVAGFHHAGYDRWKGFGCFCTFNGLMIAACKVLAEHDNVGIKDSKVAIIDCDMHWGNGTDDILDHIVRTNPALGDRFYHFSFGALFGDTSHGLLNRYNQEISKEYLATFAQVRHELSKFKPDVIIYQAGADTHINDPMGGIITTEEMYERDIKMFKIAKELDIPITWTLAGGYQRDALGNYDEVLKLHANTFKACKEVYGD